MKRVFFTEVFTVLDLMVVVINLKVFGFGLVSWIITVFWFFIMPTIHFEEEEK